MCASMEYVDTICIVSNMCGFVYNKQTIKQKPNKQLKYLD